jgi:hypothetical protein
MAANAAASSVRSAATCHWIGISSSSDNWRAKQSGRGRVNAVTLTEFEQGGPAMVVGTGYESLLGTGYHPPADVGRGVVARAEFLLKPQHRLPHNLIGHNCEIESIL